ncbi:MAG TPA: hypothetical protein VK172_14305 [Lentimicrobium sp.]|nr:hypothetical protein [Lentimicrobium sp.]
MKTNISISAISLLMITLLSFGRYASAETTKNDTSSTGVKSSLTFGITIEDEPYINDIPFDTKSIALESMFSANRPLDESYVNDIPFDTERIVTNQNLLKFKPEDEAFVNDIPFNTSDIAKKNYKCSQLSK